MIDKINDQLSAMLDDELDERECELLLSRVSRDPQLRGVWERYALIGDCIRGSVPEFVAPAMAGRIADAVASNEDTGSRRLACARCALAPAGGLGDRRLGCCAGHRHPG